uniref:Winged helix-turn-helix domain-containing protein n=1 Tax=Hyalomma excavatum TaxID=257692 RepID=A0A131XB69_9ACAR
MENSNAEEEHIVMTPRKKAEGQTTIKMERVARQALDKGNVMHEAGGDHRGIVINRLASRDDDDDDSPEISLEFRVFLTNVVTEVHTRESRELKFWFKPGVTKNDQRHSAQEFFKELVSPSDFPRDYVGFIKKIMKLMQMKYINMRKVEIEMRQLENITEPPRRPMSLDDSTLEAKMELTQEKVLEIIESAYPNPVSLTELSRNTSHAPEEVHLHLRELLSKNLIKEMESGSFTRVVQNDTEVKMVRQMPTVHGSQQPTIAIITAQYCEKLAVDVMIENKNTFVRYKTEGESNVYTLGNIGAHRVVSTKLPAVGHSRAAIIAAGNTTTRLLGTFQKVDYVFLVGVGGGVPHYTDHTQHVRLGDVVVSAPRPVPSTTNGNTNGGTNSTTGQHVYLFAEQQHRSPDHPPGSREPSPSELAYSVKTWCPPELRLQELAEKMWQQGAADPELRPWERYIEDGLRALADQESDFARPPESSDRLYMSIGAKDLIEVAHPAPPPGASDHRLPGRPVVHFGSVASGLGSVVRDDSRRHALAEEYGVRAFDTGFDTVVESIYGNRKDHYAFIRGIADYKDGSKGREWQPYAALAAAAFMKAVVCALDPSEED